MVEVQRRDAWTSALLGNHDQGRSIARDHGRIPMAWDASARRGPPDRALVEPWMVVHPLAGEINVAGAGGRQGQRLVLLEIDAAAAAGASRHLLFMGTSGS